MAEPQPFSSLDLFGADLRDIIDEVAEEYGEKFRLIMRTVDELFSEPLGREERAQELAAMGEGELARMARVEPGKLADLMREARRIGEEVK